MRAIIQELARETQVRDREGKVITSFTGTLATIMLRLIVAGLFTLAISGILFFIVAIIMGEIETSGLSFGIY